MLRTAGRRVDQAAPLRAAEMVDQVLLQEVAQGETSGHLPAPRLAVRLLHAVEEVTEELVPEEHEAGGEGSLQQAGGQALEEAPHAFLPQHLPGAIQEALVASNLGRGR